MKRKGNINVITDDDIIVTGVSNAGNNLNTVVEQFSEDIKDLKSQLKWTHKYGAVGSGSGGSSSTKWSIIAKLDGQTISDGNTISLSNGANSYNLVVAISGGSSSYSVTYTYGNTTRSTELSSENKWRLDTSIQLDTNGVISVEVTDNIQIKTANAIYVAVPYTFSELTCVRSQEKGMEEYSGDDIFISTAATDGLYVKMDYDIAVDAEWTYTWKFLNTEYEKDATEVLGKNGYIVFQIPETYLSNEYANSYSVILEIKITAKNQSTVTIIKSKTFNLIPSTLYMKLSPQEGFVYDKQIESDYYEYSINRDIAFDCRVYMGGNQSRDCGIVVYKDWDYTDPNSTYDTEKYGAATSTTEKEGTVFTLKVSFDTAGWHPITISYNIGTTSNKIVKWLYCAQVDSSYNWFKNSSFLKKSDYYEGYRPAGSKIQNINESINSSYIQKYYTDSDSSSYTFTQDATINYKSNVLINVGIQYNEINNTDSAICVIKSTDSTNNTFITIYQNKVVFNIGATTDCNLFLHKETDYDPGNPDKYHLITILIASVYSNSASNTTYYSYSVFLNGVFEGVVNSWPSFTKDIGEIEFKPGNYSINHFSVDYFVKGDQSNPINAVYDSDINYYYYTYLIKSRNSNEAVSENDTKILDLLYTEGVPNYYMSHQLVKVTNTLPDEIATKVSIPTLVARVSLNQIIPNGSDKITTTLFDWMNVSYKQDDNDIRAEAKIPINKLRYGKGVSTQEIKIPESYTNTYFYLKLQGSSTMNNKSKNFTLGITNSDTTSSNTNLLFSPNYKKEDYSTFLPESSFILKADVVDSAHTNNVAMGNFINDNNDFSYDTKQSNVDGDVLKHVRKCLSGFPVLFYLEVVKEDGEIEGTYFLGIYSFNLGRESYFNLGYKDLSELKIDEGKSASENSFLFATSSTDATILDNFIAAEIQNNGKYWDFSQFDNSVLFQQNNETSNFMFGDIVRNSNNTAANNNIQKFVESVAYAGGYLFDQIGKIFEPVNDSENPNDNVIAYHTVNVVPDYKIQYKRNNTEYTIKETIKQPATYTSLQNCVGSSEDDVEITPTLNYESLVYYYTTCMTFGLVDSVQKNLNIKSWDGKTFGIFFYDMDTCLGRDNSGQATDYFCFSDYWNSDIKEYDEDGKIIDRTNPTDVNKVATKIVNNGVTICRDYFPQGITGGYDIPSSYLFAVAKYTKVIGDYVSKTSYDSPQTIYAKWRSVDGVLENAEKFINKYYASNLKGVPDCLLNLNYRCKYLYYEDSPAGDSYNNISSYLFGRGVEITTDWLNGRLHILDAYFNLNSGDVEINKKNDAIYKEPKPDASSLNSNSDIYILRDIFNKSAGGSTESRARSGVVSFTVTAPKYTPLVINKAGSVARYLLEKENTPYNITYSFSNEKAVFGGSQLWKTLDSINTFVSTDTAVGSGTSFYISNKYFEELNGSSGTATGGFDFITPAVKDIKLNSSGYSGSLTIDENYYNIDTIDISKSRISLSIDASRATSINAASINSDKLSITNCKNLTNVTLTNAAINSCTIDPAWKKDLTELSSSKVVDLSVRGKAEKGEYGMLSLENNTSIKKVTFSKYKTVKISNCRYLTSVVQNDNDEYPLTTLSITECPSLKSLDIIATGLVTLNLSGCTNLETLTIKGDCSKLKALNLSKTKVKTIQYDSETPAEYLDLTKFTSLATISEWSDSNYYVAIGNNSAVEEIQFCNDKNKPVYLSKTFQGCTNLKRVYGNLKLNNSQLFNGLSKFSIHGSDLSEVRFQGTFVWENNIVKHPIDIIGSDDTSKLYTPGLKVTNMTFNSTNANGAFAGTSCTVFDYYYMFYNIGGATNLTSLFQSPANKKYGQFNIKKSDDEKNTLEVTGNIDSRIFKKCGNVTNLSYCFWLYGTTYKGTIYLKSPTVENSEVVNNDGLFSPLTKCTTLYRAFDGYTYAADKYLFRRNGSNYALNSIRYFNPRYILNDPITTFEWDTVLNIASDIKGKTGDLSGFFDNLTALTEAAGIFYSVNYIDYSKIFELPKDVENVTGSFWSTNAYCDKFELSSYFSNPAKLQKLRNSFRMISAPTNEYYVNMEINNNTFSSFTAIKELGYCSGKDGDFGTTDCLAQMCFDNFTKTVSSEFPFDIFAKNTQAEILSGVFANVTGSRSIVTLPGTMFENNTKLQDISALFYNFGINYNLSDNTPFAKCTKLQKADYAFAEQQGAYAITGTSFATPHLSGKIPYKFFWHGEKTSTVTKYGTDTRTEVLDEDGNVTGYTYDNVEPFTVTTKTVNATMKSMKYCFMHSNLEEYTNGDITEYIENNPSYAPYMYTSNSKTGGFVLNKNVDKRHYTIIWAFDGLNLPKLYNENPDDYENLDPYAESEECVAEAYTYNAEGSLSATKKYIAPPDLLRYCAVNCNIEGLFAYSGVPGWSSSWNGSAGNIKMFTYGIKGRLCPYMLKPVSSTTSVKNMFKYCKSINYIRDFREGYNNKAYLIPEDFFTYATKITDLSYMFEDTLQPYNSDLSGVFKPLTGTLNVAGIFRHVYWDTNDVNAITVLSSVFNTNSVSSTAQAFMITDAIQGEADCGWIKAQYVQFENIFNSRYANEKVYGNNTTNYSKTFKGYTYKEGRFPAAENLTLCNNKITDNYRAWDTENPYYYI